MKKFAVSFQYENKLWQTLDATLKMMNENQTSLFRLKSLHIDGF